MRIANNTIRAIKDFFYQELSEVYPSSEILWLFRISCSEISGFSHLHLHLNIDDRVSESELVTYSKWVKRLKNHEPIQYIIGKAWFMDLEIVVKDTVLIPRPETEELVNLILENTSNKNLRILDACSGSGCIALAFKHYLREASVFACDISKPALELSKENAKRLELDLEFIEIDLLNDSIQNLPNQLDFIVSNPPYIPLSEKSSMAAHVSEREPSIALFVEDSNPLIFYKRLSELAVTNLKPGGYIYVECHKPFAGRVQDLFNSFGLVDVTIHKDLSGNERFVSSHKPIKNI